MPGEFSGIERRLDELSERLTRLELLKEKPRAAFDRDPYLRDIVERNLEIAAQCCIDISHRIISLEGSQKPADYYEAILQMGTLDVVPADFARKLAPIAGFRNVLVHDYVRLNWDVVYEHLKELEDLRVFANHIRQWLTENGHQDP